MKDYPKILGPYDAPWGEKCVAFNKLDGSNIRFEWNPKRGWYKFGTRRHLIDRNDPEYGSAIDIFINKYGESIEKMMRDNYPKCEAVIAYGEFFGPHSIAGYHDDNWLKDAGLIEKDQSNSPKDVVLFDVNPYKQCFLSPWQFLEHFSHLHIPEVVYEGELTETFIQAVRHGEYPNLIEGVVCKGGEKHKLWMRKAKTFDYLRKIQKIFGTGWGAFWE